MSTHDQRPSYPDNPKPLEYFLYVAAVDMRMRHEEGECAGLGCSYCRFEEQFPGKPFYRTIPPVRHP